MRLRRVIVVFAAAVGLSVGVPQAISTAYAAPPAVAVHATGGVQALRVIPFIKWRTCSSQTTHWVDVDIITASGLQDWCFGYDGRWYFAAPNNVVTSVCPGNNEGYFKYIDPSSGKPDLFKFTPGAEFYAHGGVKAVYIEIDNWTGNDSCTS